MPMIYIPLQSWSLKSWSTRIKSFLHHFKIIKSEIPQSQARKDVLIAIISSIHINSVALYTQHLNFSFQAPPPNCKKLLKSRIFLYQSELINVKVLENTDILCRSIFVKHQWYKWECHNWAFHFIINYIHLRYRNIIPKSLVGEVSYKRRKSVIPNTKILLSTKIWAKQNSVQSLRP